MNDACEHMQAPQHHTCVHVYTQYDGREKDNSVATVWVSSAHKKNLHLDGVNKPLHLDDEYEDCTHTLELLSSAQKNTSHYPQHPDDTQTQTHPSTHFQIHTHTHIHTHAHTHARSTHNTHAHILPHTHTAPFRPRFYEQPQRHNLVSQKLPMP